MLYKLGLWLVSRHERKLYEEPKQRNGLLRFRPEPGQLDIDGLRMKIMPAIGGKVIEFSRYDERNDRDVVVAYIIPEDKEFSEEISRIIIMESLRG